MPIVSGDGQTSSNPPWTKDEGTKTGPPENLLLSGEGTLAADSICQPCVCSDTYDPLDKFHPWQANLRILEVTEIKTVPYVPLSHPFLERLIGTIGREYVDHMSFWTSADVENTLLDFRTYFNHHRTHHSREGREPICPCHHPSPICARFAGNHTVEAYIRHPRLPEFSKMCASCDMQVSVGKNSE